MNFREMHEQAQKASTTRNLTPEYYEFEGAGCSIVGRLKGKAAVASSLSDGTYNQYLMETDEGLFKFHLGKATDTEAGVLMEVGQIYYIEFKGKEQIARGRTVNKFHVEQILEQGAA